MVHSKNEEKVQWFPMYPLLSHTCSDRYQLPHHSGTWVTHDGPKHWHVSIIKEDFQKAFHFLVHLCSAAYIACICLSVGVGRVDFGLPSWPREGLTEVNTSQGCLARGRSPRPWAPTPGLLHWWEFVSRVSSVNIISPGCPSFIAHFHWISFWRSFLNIYPLRAGLAGRSNTQPGPLV